jgi:hypothetical protein
MRKSFSLVLAFLLVAVSSVILMARVHDNANEKKATDEITLSSDVLVGGQLLKAGRYQIACDTKAVKFSIVTEGPGTFITVNKVLEVPCEGELLTARRTNTEMSLPPNADGVKVLTKLYIKGSNVEHVFSK